MIDTIRNQLNIGMNEAEERRPEVMKELRDAFKTEKIAGFARHVFSIAREGMILPYQKRIVRALANVPKEMGGLVRQVACLTNPEVSDEKEDHAKVEITEMLAEMPGPERAAFIEPAQKILEAPINTARLRIKSIPASSHKPDGLQRVEMIRALAETPAQYRKEIAEEAAKLIPFARDPWEAALVVRGLYNARPINGANVNPQLKIQIAKIFGLLPPQERNEYAAIVSTVCRVQMEGHQKASMMEILATLPDNEARVNFANQVLQLSGLYSRNESDDAARVEIAESLLEIPQIERKDFIRQALILVKRDYKPYENSLIVSNLADIPRDRRDVIADRTIFNNFNAQQTNQILVKFREIPPEHLKEFIVCARDLLYGTAAYLWNPPSSINQEVQEHILKALYRIPPKNRKKFTQRIIEQMKEEGCIKGSLQRCLTFIITPLERPIPKRPVQTRLNLHDGDRDERTKTALLSLRGHQAGLSLSQEEEERAVRAFSDFVMREPTAIKNKAIETLQLPKRTGEYFGPLLDGEPFSLFREMTTGEEIIARLWHYTETLEESEKQNARAGMISALADSTSETGRVCNQGKTQKLLIAVLQGRLPGVEIDRATLTAAEGMNAFFANEAHRKINSEFELIDAAIRSFPDPQFNRLELMNQMREYAQDL